SPTPLLPYSPTPLLPNSPTHHLITPMLPDLISTGNRAIATFPTPEKNCCAIVLLIGRQKPGLSTKFHHINPVSCLGV
ncbi:hypothetical protein ACP6PL_16115, partial [Dapis sp. BLCC M126]|uniref:hypothetical protein n=1 Tax=Dapis sp. BLCC M126 TaxID=3400189 RepID=UPI003CF36A0C